MSRPGFEPGPPAREASTVEKSHLDSLSAGYSEPLLSRHLLTTFGPLQYCLFLNQYKLRKFLNLIQYTIISDSMFQFNLTLVPFNRVDIRRGYRQLQHRVP
jgi:hypothetical protein